MQMDILELLNDKKFFISSERLKTNERDIGHNTVIMWNKQIGGGTFGKLYQGWYYQLNYRDEHREK